MRTRLRSGFTTGACAAAAAKAATTLLLLGHQLDSVTIPFPDGSRVAFPVFWKTWREPSAGAAIIKDAGDDPDVTNGAEIVAWVRRRALRPADLDESIRIIGGTGVGIVTKPGLAVPVGEPAINPVPRLMIRQAVGEVLSEAALPAKTVIEVCVSVPSGEELAKKTLNRRLGILGGISILGTTGIVRPISAEAWTATIATSMDVAVAVGIREIVLSTGRTSERGVQNLLAFPEEALVMMGDYLDFSLQEANKRRFLRIHMAAMWAKLIKGAMRIPQTHVRHGMLEVPAICRFLQEHGVPPSLLKIIGQAHTAREILEKVREQQDEQVIPLVCQLAQRHYQQLSGIPVSVYLISPSGAVLYRL